jgi:hypothetical protein
MLLASLWAPLAWSQEIVSQDEAAVKKILADQAVAWNKGSIDQFMRAYWPSDSLTYVGGAAITYGYDSTLTRYKKKYVDRATMGKLFFTLVDTKRLSPEYYFVTGKWFLKRSLGDVGGCFTLLIKKFGSQWLIISDHSS